MLGFVRLGGLPVGFLGFSPVAGCLLPAGLAWLSWDVAESVALRSLERAVA